MKGACPGNTKYNSLINSQKKNITIKLNYISIWFIRNKQNKKNSKGIQIFVSYKLKYMIMKEKEKEKKENCVSFRFTLLMVKWLCVFLCLL